MKHVRDEAGLPGDGPVKPGACEIFPRSENIEYLGGIKILLSTADFVLLLDSAKKNWQQDACKSPHPRKTNLHAGDLRCALHEIQSTSDSQQKCSLLKNNSRSCFKMISEVDDRLFPRGFFHSKKEKRIRSFVTDERGKEAEKRPGKREKSF